MSYRFLLMALITIVGTMPMHAQFWQATDGPPASTKCLTSNSKQYVFAGTTSSAVYRSTDLGTTWVRLDKGIDDGGPNFVTVNQLAVDKNDVLFAAVNNLGILRSTDDGENWTKLDIGIDVASSARLSVSLEDLPNGKTAVFVGYDAGASNLLMRYSDDGGDTFIEIPKSNLPSAMSSIFETFLSPNSDKMFVLVAYNKGLYRSSNMGTSWTRIDSDPQSGESNDNFYTMRAHPNGTLYIGRNALQSSTKTQNAVVMRSSNDGESWEYLTNGWDNRDITNNIVTGIAFGPNGTDVWVTTSISSGTFYSSNGGDSWISQNDGIADDGSGQGITVTKDDHVFVAPNGNYIHRHLNPVSVQEELPSIVRHAQVTPNPARDHVYLNVDLLETRSVSVELYGMNGGRVVSPLTEVLSAGPHTITLPVTELPVGFYAWRLLAGTTVRTGTFSVVR